MVDKVRVGSVREKTSIPLRSVNVLQSYRRILLGKKCQAV